MVHKPQQRLSDRIVATLLAVVWLCAGIAIIPFGILHKRWIATLLGPFAIWYGLIWLRVAREGRRLSWSEALIPWRRRKL